MVEYEASVEVERPPDDVFAFIRDFPRMHEWEPSIVEQRVLTEGPIGAGTRGLEVRRMLGRRVESSWELIEYEPPRRLTMTFASGKVTGVGRFTLEPVEGGTRVRVGVEACGGRLLTLLQPIAARAFRRMDERTLRHLKEAAEAEHRADA